MTRVPAIGLRQRSMPGVVHSPFSGAIWPAVTHSCAAAAIGRVRSPTSYGGKKRRCHTGELTILLPGRHRAARNVQHRSTAFLTWSCSSYSPFGPLPTTPGTSHFHQKRLSARQGSMGGFSSARCESAPSTSPFTQKRERAVRQENSNTTRRAPGDTMHAADCCVGSPQEATA